MFRNIGIFNLSAGDADLGVRGSRILIPESDGGWRGTTGSTSNTNLVTRKRDSRDATHWIRSLRQSYPRDIKYSPHTGSPSQAHLADWAFKKNLKPAKSALGFGWNDKTKDTQALNHIRAPHPFPTAKEQILPTLPELPELWKRNEASSSINKFISFSIEALPHPGSCMLIPPQHCIIITWNRCCSHSKIWRLQKLLT